MSMQFKNAIANYSNFAKEGLNSCRVLVLQAADNLGITDLEETLKWGEPSFLTKHGTTIRMDWKSKNPDKLAIYFNCQSLMVDTIRELYPDEFEFEGNRAILFPLHEPLPEKALLHCFSLALSYHNVKHLPLLGA